MSPVKKPTMVQTIVFDQTLEDWMKDGYRLHAWQVTKQPDVPGTNYKSGPPVYHCLFVPAEPVPPPTVKPEPMPCR